MQKYGKITLCIATIITALAILATAYVIDRYADHPSHAIKSVHLPVGYRVISDRLAPDDTEDLTATNGTRQFSVTVYSGIDMINLYREYQSMGQDQPVDKEYHERIHDQQWMVAINSIHDKAHAESMLRNDILTVVTFDGGMWDLPNILTVIEGIRFNDQ